MKCPMIKLKEKIISAIGIRKVKMKRGASYTRMQTNITIMLASMDNNVDSNEKYVCSLFMARSLNR